MKVINYLSLDIFQRLQHWRTSEDVNDSSISGSRPRRKAAEKVSPNTRSLVSAWHTKMVAQTPHDTPTATGQPRALSPGYQRRGLRQADLPPRKPQTAHLLLVRHLLIALLMDGPQLKDRWAARYASVLAEDPGSSVLTLTSLGMARRSRPFLRATGRRAEPSRVIALWRDAVNSEVEICLDAEENACVLSLECRRRKEYSADGRHDGAQSCYPVFAGFKSFRSEL
jgi:hypothetical protein